MLVIYYTTLPTTWNNLIYSILKWHSVLGSKFNSYTIPLLLFLNVIEQITLESYIVKQIISAHARYRIVSPIN